MQTAERVSPSPGDSSASPVKPANARFLQPVFPYRIFGIGLNKTGTSSLQDAMRILGVGPILSAGIVHKHGLVQRVLLHGDFETAVRFAGIYRFFEDRPWNIGDMYRRLDERYPGSRFILTVRDKDRWWRSVERWLTVTKPRIADLYRIHFRVESVTRDSMIASYLRYNDEVRRHFAGRADFLEMNIEAGDGWTPLCGLLDLPVPDAPFPHRNRQAYDESDAALIESRKSRKRDRRGKPGQPSRNVNRCVQCGAALTPLKKRTEARGGKPAWVKRLHRRATSAALRVADALRAQAPRLARLHRENPTLSIDNMAVVTAFFNPGGFAARVANFRVFRESLKACGLPVLTVELAFGNDPHMLGPDDGEVLALRAPHPMWQKERLLNIGIAEMIRRGYRRIVWLDADVVFLDAKNWPWWVAAELRKTPLCQVFRRVRIDQGPGRPATPAVSSTAYHARHGAWLSQEGRAPSLLHPIGRPNGYSGFGWAARADLLERVPLYDRAIVGGGDKMIYYACAPRTDDWQARVAKMLSTNYTPCSGCGHSNAAPCYLDDYFQWARAWHDAGGADPGAADLTIRALYHGDLRNRFYHLRRDILLRHAFDPATDIAPTPNGCWTWNSDKPRLHHEVHSYFFNRHEDGPA